MAISRSQRATVVLLVVYGFGNAAAYVTSRVVADGLFLSHVGPDRLPAMYMVAAGVVALVSIGYARLARRFQLHGLVLVCLMALAIGNVVLAVLAVWMPSSLSVFGLIYLFSEIRGSLGTMHYATLVNEKFTANVAPRVVGYVGAGATFAGIAVATTIGVAGRTVETEALLYVIAAIDLATMAPIAWLWRRKRQVFHHGGGFDEGLLAHPGDEFNLNLRDAAQSRFVLGIAAIVVLAVVTSRLVEFQWKVGVADWYQRDESDLTAYFGYFYAVLYLVTAAVQLLFTGRLLNRWGPIGGLIVFPAALAGAAGGVLMSGSARILMVMITISKGCDALKRGLNDPATQLLYLNLPVGLRRQAIAFVSGIVKPLAEALAAAGLMVVASLLADQQLSYVILGFLAAWLLAIALFRPRNALATADRPRR